MREQTRSIRSRLENLLDHLKAREGPFLQTYLDRSCDEMMEDIQAIYKRLKVTLLERHDNSALCELENHDDSRLLRVNVASLLMTRRQRN